MPSTTGKVPFRDSWGLTVALIEGSDLDVAPQVGHTCSTLSLMNCNLLPPPALSQSSSAVVQNGVISRDGRAF